MRRIMVVAGMLALAMAASLAHADGGTLRFSGAIVEPTCQVGAGRVGEAQELGARYYRCTEQADATPGQAAQAYMLSVTVVSASSSDRLIGYFAGYASGAPKLVTQTYE